MDEAFYRLAGPNWAAPTNLDPAERWIPVTSPPAFSNPGDETLRAALGLSGERSDYMLVHSLLLFEQFPDLLADLGQTRRTYSLEAWRPSAPSFVGGQLRSNRNGPPKIDVRASFWPVAFETVLSYQAPGFGMLTQREGVTPIKVRQAGSILFPEWSAYCGIDGAITGGNWGPDYQFVIRFTPRGFPAQAFSDMVSASSDLLQLITIGGYGDRYWQAVDPATKSALALASFAKQTTLEEL